MYGFHRLINEACQIMRPRLCNNSQSNDHLRHVTGSEPEIFQKGGSMGFLKKKMGPRLILVDLHVIFKTLPSRGGGSDP